MDNERACELEELLRQGIGKAYGSGQPVIWQGLDSNQDNRFTIGGQQIWLALHEIFPKGTNVDGRHKVIIRSKQVRKQRQFHENKKGWVNVDAIINEAVYRLRLEREHRLISDARSREHFTAQTEASRLRSHYGIGRQARASEDDSITAGIRGTNTKLAVSFSGLTVKEAEQLLEAARKLKVLPSSRRIRAKSKTVWDHLGDEEDC